ncbi:MAG: DUF4105 domain-containing protein [Polaribacter sp.]
MQKKYLLFFFLFSFLKPVQSQVQLSVYSEISIVTAGPGTELYEAFGHSAIRIKDPILRLDLIYNYGIFDFDAPNFYGNFVKGKLLYKLGRYDFKYFIESYKKQNRWVKQQILNLTQTQKQAFFLFLETNVQPKNASYLYDPYYNNCATKLRDITISILGDKVVFNDTHLEKNQSLRQLMDKEIPWNTWGSFGINLALGSKLDKKAISSQYMYLPDYVFSGFKNSTIFIKNQPESLVKKEEIILDFEEVAQEIPLWNPLFIFLLITIIGLYITYRDFKNKKRTKWLDVVVFFSTGFIGVLIFLLWFFTDHSTTPNNFNFLWAFAPNLVIAFLLLKDHPQKWIQKYILIVLLLLLLIPILWIAKVQLFPFAVIPLLILFFVRYLFLLKLLSVKK